MTGHSLTKNLAHFLAPSFDVPVYTFDSNGKRRLPCIVVGFETENEVEPNARVWEVDGFATVMVNGHSDRDNSIADGLMDELLPIVRSAELNAPAEGEDERPRRNFTLLEIVVNSVERTQDDNSSFVVLKFTAICNDIAL